jgi:hypothetical protein
MRCESKVTSVSWIPSEAIDLMTVRAPFDLGLFHYDEPPPSELEELEALRRADRFRFANELRAWVEVEGNTVVAAGYLGGGMMGSTTLRFARRQVVFPAVGLPDVQKAPEILGNEARFVQTAGGRAGLPAPRRVSYPPFVQWVPPTVWTTLALTIRADGSSDYQVLGASPFPRHWLFDASDKLVAKAGLADFELWWRRSFGEHTPWGDEDSPALLVPTESELERQLSDLIMHAGVKPTLQVFEAGDFLVRQDEGETKVLLILNGIVGVDVDGRQIAQVGPGAIVGERALLEGGRRTATLFALTRCKVASAEGAQIDPAKLHALSRAHHREERVDTNGTDSRGD